MKTAVPCCYHLDVEVSPERVGQVGRTLGAHLRFWDLEDLVAPVCDGATLLLTAIDEHATDKTASIEMWWNGQHLITAVAQNDHHLRPDRHLRDCLTRIAAMSDGWGCCATGTGSSKIVWFSQRARSGQRVPLVPLPPAPALSDGLDLPREPAVAGLAADGGPAAEAGPPHLARQGTRAADRLPCLASQGAR